MMGFDFKGMPTSVPDDWYEVSKEQGVPVSKGKHTYKGAMREAFPEMSLTQINRLFKDKAVKVYGYVCEPDEDPNELYGPSFTFSTFRAGKKRGFLFK